MLAKLMREDGGVKPIEGKLAPMDHIHQRIEHLGFLSDFISKAEVVTTLNQAQCLHLVHTVSVFPVALWKLLITLSASFED
jgi:hypothetical protein